MTTKVPMIEDMLRRNTDSTVETWYPIDGKLRHLVQVREKGEAIQFYTDGVLESYPEAYITS